jgi:hypothetical protein
MYIHRETTVRQTETEKCENKKRNQKDRVGCLHQLRTPTVVDKSDEGAVKDDISLPVACDESNTSGPFRGELDSFKDASLSGCSVVTTGCDFGMLLDDIRDSPVG